MGIWERLLGKKSFGTQAPPYLRQGGAFSFWPYPDRPAPRPEESLALAASVRRITDLYCEARLTAYVGDREEPNHPAVQLLEAPNPFYDGEQLSELVVWSLLTDGNAYLLVTDDRRIYWLDPSRVEPKTDDPRLLVTRYEYREAGAARSLRPDSILHLRRGCDPKNPAKGWSPVKTIASDIQLESACSEYGAAVVANMGVPSVAIAPKSGETLPPTPEQNAQLKLRWQSETAGRNRGNVVVMPFPVDIKELQLSPDKLNPGRLLEQATDRICAAIGIDPMVVGLPSSRQTYSNYEQALDAAVRQVVIPLQATVAKQLTRQLVVRTLGDRRAELGWDRSEVAALQDDAAMLRESAARIYQAGVATLNEARAIAGLPPIRGGDETRLPGAWR
jgi:HK97 family phage portal protein